MMNANIKILLSALLSIGIISTSVFADKQEPSPKAVKPVVVPTLFKEAAKNNSWKKAFITGKNAQVVFMSVSSKTNPNNELGEETHPFDQIIFVAKGNGKATIAGKTTTIKTHDMIFVPQGVVHNVVNQSKKKELKLVSIYSNKDIPEKTTYQTKADEEKASKS